MPELKHNFLKGRMNKDLDERLVPDGEYRDALNIEVITSEDSNSGAVQTVKGNIDLSSLPIMNSTKCVGKILDEKNDKLYWLVSQIGNRPSPAGANLPPVYGDFTISDVIMEFDNPSNEVLPVVVDTFYTAATLTGHDPKQGDGDWIRLTSSSWSGTMDYTIYPGMEIDCIDSTGKSAFPDGTVVVDVNLTQWQVRLSNKPNDPIDLKNNITTYQVKFENFNRALNFKNKEERVSDIVTGINIIDDFLFWTDNQSEPKKINITKCKKEREINPYVSSNTDIKSQSMLVISDTSSSTPGALTIGRGNSPWTPTAPIPLKEEHITVVRKSPVTTLNLEMRNSPREGNLVGILDYTNPTGRPNTGLLGQTLGTLMPGPNPFNPFWDSTGNGQVKETTWINFGGPNSKVNQIPLLSQNGWAAGVPIYEIGDTIIITTNTIPEEIIRAKVTNRDRFIGGYEVDILSYSETIGPTDLGYTVMLEQPDPLFEFKFPRFSYRYKYEDGEYSAFAPFSEIAFLPEKFEYLPKKGYNLGMTNNLRKLVIKDFVDNKLLPPDVISIDILYKESASPNIYTVKTITRNDFEWDAISVDERAPDVSGMYTGTRGYLNITSELIHAVLPSNQLLRPWDNVPRQALAQEITKNRLVYGNYLQNYNMRSDTGLGDGTTKPININLELTSLSKPVGREHDIGFHYSPEQRDQNNAYRYDPAKSIKSLRTYQLGVVYRDKYGRETPVFSTSVKRDSGDTNRASLYLEKTLANEQNKLRAQIKNKPPIWAESFKFFIKETSNEYYNLAMDRWYNAEDDNIWISFPSSERNKVDIDTFLVLKKEKDQDTAVEEQARYKILAIENEAPLFIKTTEHSFGRCQDGDSGGASDYPNTVFRTDTGTNDTGFPKPNASYMYVAANSFGIDNDDGKSLGLGWHRSIIQQGRGNLYMRMRTPGLTSNWYKISSITLEQGVGAGFPDYYRIDIEEGIFGEDMSITCTDPNTVTTASISAGLSLEIKQNIIENRPEFEGRFFVKIYKDQLLVDKLIKPTLEATEYSIQEAKAIGYINDNTKNITVHSTGSSYINSTTTWQSEGITSWAKDNSWTTGGIQYLAQQTKLSLINEEDDQFTLPLLSTRAGSVVNHPDAFWGNKSGWFIDQCKGGRGGYGWKSGGGVAPYGRPIIRISRGKGIWNDGHDMHLSYTTMGEEQSGEPWKRGLWEWSEYRDEIAFLNKLIGAGTMFKWKEDPDQHIYVTKATWQPHAGAVGEMPFGEQLFNYWSYSGSENEWLIGGHYYPHALRNRFHISFERLLDGDPMGAPGGVHDARYSPVNDPSTLTYFNTTQPGVPKAAQGTCSDTKFNGDEQACLDASGTWTSSGLSNPSTKAPGIRQDFDGPAGFKTSTSTNPVGDFINQPGRVTLQIIEPIVRGQSLESASTNPAVWETEPKEDIGLDIYHEVGQVYPIELNNKTNELFAPIGSVVECWRSENSAWVSANPCWDGAGNYIPCNTSSVSGGAAQPTPTGSILVGNTWVAPIRVKSWNDNTVTLEDDDGNLFVNNTNWPNEHMFPGDHISFKRPDGSKTSTVIESIDGSEYTLERNIHERVMTMPWFNCYSFGNGVESDRVRDDFNQVTIGNGPKASTTLEEPYLEERRGSGLIYSGIYNSISGINNLNQFIQAEKITKDLNPTYGSIQKLHTRDTNLVTLCEDKCLKILANKDALFNADGNTNVTATSSVLGQTIPFAGEYGISKNPESFASESFRAYFTDRQRGAVLRLSQDGLTPISEAGMKDWFADNLPLVDYLVGSYDDRKSTYNLTLNSEQSKTVSFSEKAKGWTSFKSFIPEVGESLNNNYYTFKDGNIWKHHEDSVDRNSFYKSNGEKDLDINSTITVLFNDDPGSVKGFGTLNYEGTQARITQDLLDPDYYNNEARDGWYVSDIKTNLQETSELEFKGKEEKWFSQIKGVTTELSNIDTREFSVQGIGNVTSVSAPPVSGCTDKEALNYLPNATIDDGSCTYCVYGCMTEGSANYNGEATCDDGSCIPCVYGCTNEGNSNHNPLATCDDGSCLECIYGCMDSTASDYDPTATCDDGSCTYLTPESWDCVEGACIDPGDGSGLYATALLCAEFCVPPPSPCPPNDPSSPFYTYTNFCDSDWCVPTVNHVDCACCTSTTTISGCMDSTASNYDPLATVDDGSCIYLCDEVWIPTIDKIIPDSGSCLTPTIPNLNYSNFDGEMFASGIIPNWHNGDTWHWNVVMMPNSLTSWPQGGSGQFSTPNVNVHFQGPPPPLGSNWMEWVTYGDYELVVTHYRNGGDNSPTGECTYTVEFTIGCTQT